MHPDTQHCSIQGRYRSCKRTRSSGSRTKPMGTSPPSSSDQSLMRVSWPSQQGRPHPQGQEEQTQQGRRSSLPLWTRTWSYGRNWSRTSHRYFWCLTPSRCCKGRWRPRPGDNRCRGPNPSSDRATVLHQTVQVVYRLLARHIRLAPSLPLPPRAPVPRP